ncbi:uncharacterized protein LOC123566102 [Mercenaria mercenaria]|uniref:uncharacterized protein LOC123566102 n=1 Tax=Mercenaria mercenaria TaxID=6596 RepID=UPI00234F0802|nr:uncharacterized protein LOC123566102 [Mercenaria mercenaria]
MADKTPQKPRGTGIDGVELFNMDCVVCKKNKILTEAQYHCKYCGVMCENCSAKHQKTPKQTGHWAQKIKRIRQELPTSAPSFSSIKKCEHHPNRHIKGYCLDHGELYCNDCMRDRHFDCTVESVEVMSEDVSREPHMIDARNELEDLKRRNKMARNGKKDEIAHLQKQAEKFEAHLRQVRDKINVIFDDMLQAILRDKDAFCKAEEEIITKDISECTDVAPVLETASSNFDDSFRSGGKTEMWISLKKLQSVLNHYDEIVTKIENDKSEVKFEFVPSKHLKALLESPENIGTMKVTSSRLYGNDVTLNTNKTETDPKGKTKLKLPWAKNGDIQQEPWKINRIDTKGVVGLPSVVTTPQIGRSSSVVGLTTLKSPDGKIKSRSRGGTSKHDYIDKDKVTGPVFGPIKNVKLTYLGRKEILISSDTELTCVTGSTFLPNGRLVLVDNHNKSLKLLNGEFELLSSTVFEERPWNVTHCYKSVVAVSFPYDNTVVLITTGQDMQNEGKIKTDRTCLGMAFHKTEKWLYIACGKGADAQIQAYSLEGYLRKVIIPKSGVFLEPCYMVMSADCTKLFVSDLYNGIICFNTKSGDLIYQYKDKKIKRYWDLALDTDGRVYVVTTGPDCIYVLMGDHNGQLVTEFRAGNHPCSLSYSSIIKSLVVTRWKAEDVEVLRFV